MIQIMDVNDYAELMNSIKIMEGKMAQIDRDLNELISELKKERNTKK